MVQVLYLLFDVKGILLVIVGKQVILLMLGYIKLIGEERSYSPKLHNALAAIHDRNLVLTHQLFATMSSDELKKDKHHQRKISFTALVFLYYIIVIKAPT